MDSMPNAAEWSCPDCLNACHVCLYCGDPGVDTQVASEWNTDATTVMKCCLRKCGRFYHYK
jgi:hypothetical protein